jgi:hypothetical protein
VKRRLLIIGVAAAALLGVGSAASAEGGYWACAGVYAIDKGVCLRNPWPDHLPGPGDLPPLPAPPPPPSV